MNTEWVIDASVLAKCVFMEDGSEAARTFMAATPGAIAPDFILMELTSIAAKKVRRGDVEVAYAAEALARAEAVLGQVLSSQPLRTSAFKFAWEHGVSVSDGLYLALASLRKTAVITADLRLVGRCKRSGLQHLVQTL